MIRCPTCHVWTTGERPCHRSSGTSAWVGLCFEIWAPDPQPGDEGPVMRVVARFAYFLEALDYRDGLDQRHIPCVVRSPIGAYCGTTLKNIYAQLDADPRGEEGCQEAP